jgi:hypothetical protein
MYQHLKPFTRWHEPRTQLCMPHTRTSSFLIMLMNGVFCASPHKHQSNREILDQIADLTIRANSKMQHINGLLDGLPECKSIAGMETVKIEKLTTYYFQ